MILEERMLRLIAIGASISANCQSCLETNAAKALENGATELEIAEAIWVGTLVRRGTASKMDKFTASLNLIASPSVNISEEGCECTEQ